MTDTKPARDFTDVAIWRGGIVVIVVGHLLSISVTAVRYGGGVFDMTLLANTLRFALEPAALVMGFCSMAVALVIGFFVMAAYKGDHTTYRAAMIIGARTGAIAFAFALVVGMLLSRGSILSAGVEPMIEQLLVGLLIALAVGAILGLAARLAAGAPTIELQQTSA